MRNKLESRSVLNKETGCIEWTRALSHGYGLYCIKDKDGKWRNKRAHRLAYEEYVGKIPEGLLVCHHCDNRKCINPEHLFTGTYQDNNSDKTRKGRNNSAYGVKQGLAKLTDEKVRLIRQLSSYGVAKNKIAIGFGVTAMTIGEVVSRKTWKHVKKEQNND